MEPAERLREAAIRGEKSDGSLGGCMMWGCGIVTATSLALIVVFELAVPGILCRSNTSPACQQFHASWQWRFVQEAIEQWDAPGGKGRR